MIWDERVMLETRKFSKLRTRKYQVRTISSVDGCDSDQSPYLTDYLNQYGPVSQVDEPLDSILSFTYPELRPQTHYTYLHYTTQLRC